MRLGLSFRDPDEVMNERRIEVDHVTVYRWVQRFSPLLVEAGRHCRHSVGDRWFIDITWWWLPGMALRERLGADRARPS
jgi:transposase-like protein